VAIDTIDNGAYDYIIKGESAYLRAQMIIDHIIKNKNMGKFLMEQKQKENILIGTIIFMFLVLVIFALATRGFI
jgi:hypothetical protein